MIPADACPLEAAADDLRCRTAVVVPVYFPPGLGPQEGRSMLDDLTRALLRVIASPEMICLSVDGPGPGREAAEDVGRAYGVVVTCSERNMGKLAALREGARLLLPREGTKYLATVDQDGDHFPHELLNLVRAARHVGAFVRERSDRVLVIGGRVSRHRPLGFARGEVEELADRVLLDTLQYDAARAGRPLCLEFAAAIDEFPDFHSGYKLFTAPLAPDVLLGEPRLAGVAEEAYYRHAVEAVLTVEAVKAGAWLATVRRSTLDRQPVSTFGLLDRPRLVADKIIWPCRRLGVPATFADQWIRNHVPRLLLRTLAPEGPEELAAVHRLVLEGLGADEPPRAPGRFETLPFI